MSKNCQLTVLMSETEGKVEAWGKSDVHVLHRVVNQYSGSLVATIKCDPWEEPDIRLVVEQKMKTYLGHMPRLVAKCLSGSMWTGVYVDGLMVFWVTVSTLSQTVTD